MKITNSTLELFEKDLWKDARKLELVTCDGQAAITRYSDQQCSAKTEIQFLQKISKYVSFKIPRVLNHSTTSITFEYIVGTRAYNLLADLSELHESETNNVYYSIAEKLIEILAHDLTEFQHAYGEHKNDFPKTTLYPVYDKLKNVYDLLADVLSLQLDNTMFDPIASTYANNARVPFRDATPKNVILNIPELYKTNFKNRKDRLRAVKAMVKSGELNQKISKENVYHIDFTGCCFLCPVLDDWVALNNHQASFWLDHGWESESRKPSTEDLCTRFVRFSRFAGRKLAYRLLNRSGHKIRFILDQEGFYFEQLEKISENLCEEGLLRNRKIPQLMISLQKATRLQPDEDFFHQWKKKTSDFRYYSDVFPN